MSEEKFTASEVSAWLDATQADLRRVDAEMQPLLEEHGRLEGRVTLLRDLLRSFDTPIGLEAPRRSGDSGSLPRPAGAIGEYVVARAVEILADEGKPLHINELHRQFIERGFDVPGAGKPANLIVHLRKTDAIGSPQRGIYGLATQVGPLQPRRRKKRTARRRT
jgi:hypothetical protein